MVSKKTQKEVESIRKQIQRWARKILKGKVLMEGREALIELLKEQYKSEIGVEVKAGDNPDEVVVSYTFTPTLWVEIKIPINGLNLQSYLKKTQRL